MTRQSSPPSSSESSTRTPWVSCHVCKRCGLPRILMLFKFAFVRSSALACKSNHAMCSRLSPSNYFSFSILGWPSPTSSLPFNCPVEHLFSLTLDKNGLLIYIAKIACWTISRARDNPYWSSRWFNQCWLTSQPIEQSIGIRTACRVCLLKILRNIWETEIFLGFLS